VVVGGGGRRAFCFWRFGRKVDTGGARGGAGDGKEEERERQGNTGGEVWEMVWCLYRLGPGQTRGTRGLSGPMHFGPKSETGMDARGHVPTALSVWIAPLGHVFSPREHVRTAGGHLGRPAEDALRPTSMHCSTSKQVQATGVSTKTERHTQDSQQDLDYARCSLNHTRVWRGNEGTHSYSARKLQE
jgi:hypothetical protein